MTVTIATAYRACEAMAVVLAQGLVEAFLNGKIDTLDRAAMDAACDRLLAEMDEMPEELRERLVKSAAWRVYDLWRQQIGTGPRPAPR